MTTQTKDLRRKHCHSCEDEVAPLSKAEARIALELLPEWKLMPDGKRIRRNWRVQDFASGVHFLQKVAILADQEGHHPDLHLVDFRNLTIELSTHAVGGLTENDIILAAKIDELPIALELLRPISLHTG